MKKPIIITICLLLTFFVGTRIAWPKYQDLKDLQQNIEEKKIELEHEEEYWSELANISEELKEYQDSLSKIEMALPADLDLPSLFNFLQKKASQSGLVLNSISWLTTTPFEEKSKIQETYVALSLSGSYTSFKNLLSLFQKSARLIEIESINFSSPTKGETFTFNLKIKVYSY